jgi:hypothetical protein
MLLLALLLTLTPTHVRAAGGSPTRDDSDNESIVYRNGAACGVERWLVKTGMDPDVRKVSTSHVVPTTIGQLRNLRPPAVLPPRTRIRPVETTVYALDGTLVRYKEETDSDVHIVIADAAGKTMIVEIPDAADCIAGTSPFRGTILQLRTAFDSRFQPNKRAWQRPGLHVHVVGVGFFDFLHGQSGVAPNGIELHPVLAMTWPGGGAGAVAPVAPVVLATPTRSTPTPPAATATPATQQGALQVTVTVSPNPVA